MGFNFQAGHPADVFEKDFAERLVAAAQKRFGTGVPLGTRGAVFSLPDELASSSWKKLQTYAAKQLGAKGCAQINAVDAWQGVYLDAEAEREELKFERPRGIRVEAGTDDEATMDFAKRLQATFAKADPSRLGGGSAKEEVVQVGNLRALLRELQELLTKVGIERTEAAVEAKRQSYVRDDDRVDADPHIQCLCHAWLTATHALQHHAPLWLVK